MAGVIGKPRRHLALAIVLLVAQCASAEGVLDQARQLMSERYFQAALARLRLVESQMPDSAQVQFLIGQAYFRMEQLAQAEAAFDRALLLDPKHDEARHRRWALWLARSPENKSKVEQAIAELLQARGSEPAALLTAYHGYGYLWQRDRQAELVRGLDLRAKDHPLRPTAAALLYEELLGQRDRGVQREMAELYVEHYADQSQIDSASRALVILTARRFEDAALRTAALERLIARYPDNRYLLQHAATAVLAYGGDLQRANAWLKRHRESAASEPERLESLYLLGVLALSAERYAEARTYLQQVLIRQSEHARAHYRLAEIAQAQRRVPQAIRHYRQAVELNVPFADAEQRLAELLNEYDPARYFAAVSGVVRFADVSLVSGFAGMASASVAWGDYDDDGWPDILLAGPRVLRNLRGRGFAEVTDAIGLGGFSDYTGGSWVDYDDDGDLDLLLTGRAQNRLLRNSGRYFVDLSDRVFGRNLPHSSEAVAWGDMDNDGDLDGYFANYGVERVERGRCRHDDLYRNDDGRLIRSNGAVGVVNDEPLCGRGVLWSDIDKDGLQDLLVVNYRLDPNQLWLNQGGRFRDAAAEYGVRGDNVNGYFGHSIGAVVADFDNDSDNDVFVSNLAHPRYIAISDPSRLLINEGVLPLVDRFSEAGLRFEETSSDPAVADVDNDGDLDLFVTSVYRGRFSRLYLNDGTGRFRDVSWLSAAQVQNGWEAAFTDYDRDGAVDLLVGSEDGVTLLRNTGNDKHWLTVAVRDQDCNRFGVGAKITLRYADQRQSREIFAGKGTGAQEALEAHFGLGDHAGPVIVEVKNLCGRLIRFISAVDRRLSVAR